QDKLGGMAQDFASETSLSTETATAGRSLEPEATAQRAIDRSVQEAGQDELDSKLGQMAEDFGPTEPPLEPGRTPLREFDIDRYGTFKAGPRVGDQLEGHEMLQNAWLKENGYILRRGSGPISTENPAVALGETLHKAVGREQGGLGLFTRGSLRSMSPFENIQLNAEAMRRAGVPEHVIRALVKEAVEHAWKLE
ncbi:MAG TPA: hypothetical protein VEZ90_11075, partial [Blastocatellia bacterium]|nr:hypothetical protein [Blastocatellia bacterium]